MAKEKVKTNGGGNSNPQNAIGTSKRNVTEIYNKAMNLIAGRARDERDALRIITAANNEFQRRGSRQRITRESASDYTYRSSRHGVNVADMMRKRRVAAALNPNKRM